MLRGVYRLQQLGARPWLAKLRCLSTLPAQLFRIVGDPNGARGAVATRDLLPGTEIINEAPLFEYTMKDAENLQMREYQKTRSEIAPFLRDMYEKFMTLPASQRETLLSMQVPEFDEEMHKLRASEKKDFIWTDKELDTALHVVQALCTYDFNPDQHVRSAFENIHLITHSCGPNCVTYVSEGRAICRTIRGVRAGKLLTASMMPHLNLAPTYVRRYEILVNKGFTCQCARCRGPGDDARQFACEKKDCQGVHLACQPISDRPLPHPELAYDDDLQYHPPYLLPCTVCQQPPSPEYEQRMLALEQRIPELLEAIENVTDKGVAHDEDGIARIEKMTNLVDEVHLPMLHSYSLPVMLKAGGIELGASVYFQDYSEDPNVEGAVNALRLSQRLEGPANKIAQVLCGDLASVYAHYHGRHLLLKNAKRFAQNAIRIHAILHGRELRHPAYDALLVRILEDLGEKSTEDNQLTSCSFCQESPRQAAMEKRQVGDFIYCSKGCEVAHGQVPRTQPNPVGPAAAVSGPREWFTPLTKDSFIFAKPKPAAGSSVPVQGNAGMMGRQGVKSLHDIMQKAVASDVPVPAPAATSDKSDSEGRKHGAAPAAHKGKRQG